MHVLLQGAECVTVLNPVVVVVQGRCTSVKRVLTPRSCDRYIMVHSANVKTLQ